MNARRSKRQMAALILAIIIGLLFISELIFSALPSLGNVATWAEELGWTAGGTRAYFVVLALLDAVGGGFAAAVIWTRIKGEEPSWGKTAALGLLITLFVYALYQFGAAFFLPEALRPLYWGIGVVYALFGIALRVIMKR